MVLAVLVILFVLAASLIVAALRSFERKTSDLVTGMFHKAKEVPRPVITEADLETLPEPVQRYLRYARIIGKERISSARLKQKGVFRIREGMPWMPFEAEQYYTVDPPALIWKATFKMASLPVMLARDTLLDGKGEILGKVLGLKRLVHGTGPKYDQGGAMRYLNEVMWFPTAYLSDHIQWEAIDSGSARATLYPGGTTVSAVLYFNEKGELVDFIADRYMDVGGDAVLEKWSTPVWGYKEMGGLRIPTQGEGVWLLDSGDYCYIKLDIIEIEYDNPSLY